MKILNGAMCCALLFYSSSSFSDCTIGGWADSYGTPTASTASAYYGECGLEIKSDGTASHVSGAALVEDQTPGNVSPPVTDYAARFYFNPNDITLVQQPAELIIFRGWREDDSLAFEVGFSICDGKKLVFLKSGGSERTDNIAIGSGWNEITVWWHTKGTMKLRVAGVGEQEKTIQALSSPLVKVQLGVPTGTLRLFTGSMYFDTFASTRGTDPGPKVNVCGRPLVVLNDLEIDSTFSKVCKADEMRIDKVKVKADATPVFKAKAVKIGRKFTIENGAKVSFVTKF